MNAFLCWVLGLQDAFIAWLDRWQALIAGLVGAAAVTLTVWWTLSAERRRRDKEAAALRIALGAEIRQHGMSALSGCRTVMNLVTTAESVGPGIAVTLRQLENATRFPDPVIYPHSAASLGALGECVHDIVFFYGQVDLLREAVRRLREAGEAPMYPRAQLITFAQGLFNAAEAAAKVLPALPQASKSAGDRVFEHGVQETKPALAKLWEAALKS